MSFFKCIACQENFDPNDKIVVCFGQCGTAIHSKCVSSPTSDPIILCASCKSAPSASKPTTAQGWIAAKLAALMSDNYELKVMNSYILQQNAALLKKLDVACRKLEGVSKEVISLNENIGEAPDKITSLAEHESRRKRHRGDERSSSASSARSRSTSSRVPLPPNFQYLRNLSSANTSHQVSEQSYARTVTYGTATNDTSTCKLKTVKTLAQYKKIFISGMSPETTPKELHDYLKEQNINVVKVCRIRTQSRIYASFCIVLDDEFYEQCKTSAIWPRFTIIDDFHRPLTRGLTVETFPIELEFSPGVSLSSLQNSTQKNNVGLPTASQSA